eukprot:jgi/Chrzof1/8345/Cz03g07010.t1
MALQCLWMSRLQQQAAYIDQQQTQQHMGTLVKAVPVLQVQLRPRGLQHKIPASLEGGYISAAWVCTPVMSRQIKGAMGAATPQADCSKQH